MTCWAPSGVWLPRRAGYANARCVSRCLVIAIGWGCAVAAGGCRASGSSATHLGEPGRPVVLVVAPVINLSGSEHLDALRFTDLLASELVGFHGVSVIPVNLALGALAQRGSARVTTAAEARALAQELGADATIVAAVSEYDPYDPPTIGLTMQWYAAQAASGDGREAGGEPDGQAGPGEAPELQVQRVFDGASADVLEEVRDYARRRDGDESPYGWRKVLKSQEEFIRFCSWSMIRSMLTQRGLPAPGLVVEAER